LPVESNDLLITQVLDRDLSPRRQRIAIGDSQQVAVMGDREEAQRPDILDGTNEAEIDLPCLKSPDDASASSTSSRARLACS